MEFGIREIIALASLTFSIFALAFSYLKSSKKYELTASVRKEILEWFEEATNTLMILKAYIAQEKTSIDSEMAKQLAKLSSLIEVGRFYFPNINKGDGFGEEKPAAYHGYRNLVLDFLVFSYDIALLDNAHEYICHLERLQREYTSIVFGILNPEIHLRQTRKHTGRSFENKLSLEDFLESDPSKLSFEDFLESAPSKNELFSV